MKVSDFLNDGKSKLASDNDEPKKAEQTIEDVDNPSEDDDDVDPQLTEEDKELMMKECQLFKEELDIRGGAKAKIISLNETVKHFGHDPRFMEDVGDVIEISPYPAPMGVVNAKGHLFHCLDLDLL